MGPRARGLVWPVVGLGIFRIRARFAAQRPGGEHGEGMGVSLGEHGRRACAYSGSGPQLWGGPWLDLASTEALHEQESWRGRAKLPTLSPQVLKGSVADGRCSAVVQPSAFLISSL